ncbi:ATP-dependent DNA helicase RecG [Secundilactobacillus malefermentans]|nr:ATP-dependent DNA helicase RecG [Secundilactobacillus malefermentans]KRM59652.1 ATP-dependent DNA helicase RecG [Secundilactobacillus malefermentans DSM 5705 = KCTC 3548]QEA32439.1 ATP-dependent DNA helicase RecG [Secundilactobacillus malefermentans]
MEMALSDSVQVLPSVGPKRLEALQDLGISTIEDLLTYFPYRYDDLKSKELAEIQNDEKVTLSGTVASEPVVSYFGRHRNRLVFRLLIKNDVVPVTFFNQPWLDKQVVVGEEIAVYGRFDGNKKTLSGMKIIKAAEGMDSIYPASKSIRQSTIRNLIEVAWDKYQNEIQTIIPSAIRQRYKLMDRKLMIHDMHFPDGQYAAKLARRTAKFEEFFIFQMRLQLVKQADRLEDGLSIDYKISELTDLIASLPFELTDAQKRVVNEICVDLKRPTHMNRLLQGDVGSGKTIVAALAVYATITAGYQTALMAPTEILAEQHAENLQKTFKDFPVNIVLLTGSTKVAVRKQILPRIKNGEVNLIIGTHALIQDEVQYHKLGLVIIDEQHRFGVHQRQILREKGERPNVLAMTATPIPRTLQITSYGEMDISVIDELPAGRKKIKTTWLRSNETDKALRFVRDQLTLGRQIYVVTPLIEESEVMDMRNAQAIYDRLRTDFEPAYKVGLLNGRMKSNEKEDVMRAFKANEFQVLVATTVIEVGVDVPNATVMMIYDADHFGLAQLHQLRGRVGRSNLASYCLLIADPKNQQAIERMEVMTKTNDGFVLSQRDLELRGSGDILGNKQSGLPEFNVGDPVADLKMLSIAQEEANEITDDENWEREPDNQVLGNYLNENWKGHMAFD